MAKPGLPQRWQNKIVRYADEAPDQLLVNPRNFRLHPQNQQAALAGALTEVGWIAPVIVNTTTQHVIDGHARIALAISRGEPTVPVAYVELSEDAERLALATFDPVGALAGQDDQMLNDLLADIRVQDAGLSEMLAGMGPPTDPQAEWQGMPEFSQDDQSAVRQIIISFARLEDVDTFARLIERKITPDTKSIWYPALPQADHSGVYVTEG